MLFSFHYQVSGGRNAEVAVITDADRAFGRQRLPAGAAVIGPESFGFVGVIHDYHDSGLTVRSLISQYVFVPGKHAQLATDQDRILTAHPGKCLDDVDQAVIAVIASILLPWIRAAVHWVGPAGHANFVTVIDRGGTRVSELEREAEEKPPAHLAIIGRAVFLITQIE